MIVYLSENCDFSGYCLLPRNLYAIPVTRPIGNPAGTNYVESYYELWLERSCLGDPLLTVSCVIQSPETFAFSAYFAHLKKRKVLRTAFGDHKIGSTNLQLNTNEKPYYEPTNTLSRLNKELLWENY